MIVSAGPDSASIMLVGDFASSNDIINGFALSNIGATRQLFNDAGVHLDSCYRTLYIKDGLSYYGRAAKRSRIAIEEAFERAKPLDYKEILFNEIVSVSPSVVVPMGELSLKVLAGVKGIEKYRGSVLPPVLQLRERLKLPLRVIPTYSNKQLFDKWSNRVICSFDIQRILKHRNNNEPIKDNNLIWTATTVSAFRAYLARQKNPDFVTLDIETVGGILSCIGFSFDGHEGVCVPLIDKDIDLGNRTLLWFEVNRLLKSNIPKVNQNIKFDWSILQRYGFTVNNIIGDTMLGAHLLYPELPKKLAFWTSIYTEQPYYKDEGKEYNPKVHEKAQFYAYNAKDAIVTWNIHNEQKKELEESNLQYFYDTYTIPLMKLYKRIDERGLLVDLDVREQIIAKYETFANIKHKTIELLAGHPINLNAPTQVQKLVYEELKFPKHHKQDDAGLLHLTTEEDTLVDLMIFHPLENTMGEMGKNILGMIIDWRKITKILQYAKINLHPDNRLRTSYKLHGTETGRTSGGRSLDSMLRWKKDHFEQIKLGGSLQTLPKHGFKIGNQYYGRDLRDMFIATPGYVLVEGDLSQAEARAVALMAEDYELLASFDIPPGVHKLTASWIYRVPPEEIKKGTNEYHMGKIVRHAGNNNMKERTLSEQTHIDITEAKALLDKFHAASPRIRGIFHREIRDIVRKTHQLKTPFGRKRDFFAKIDENLYNEAIGYIQQSTISDATKFAMLRVDKRCPWAYFVYEGHDAGMAEVPEDRVDEYKAVWKEEAEKPIDWRQCSLPRDYDLVIPTEIEVGTCWGNMKGI
jgi:DNA polymerase I